MEERSAVESTEWVHEGCLFSARTSPSSKPSETVRSDSPPASRPPSFSLDPGSLPLSVSLSPPSLFRLFLSFSLLFSLSLYLSVSLFLVTRRPCRRFSIPSRPPSRYYGNFEPIRKSIATAAGKNVETARVASRRAAPCCSVLFRSTPHLTSPHLIYLTSLHLTSPHLTSPISPTLPTYLTSPQLTSSPQSRFFFHVREIESSLFSILLS